MNQEEMKKCVAEAALKYIEPDAIIGVGSGSTVDYFIDVLASIKHTIEGTVASSNDTEKKLRAHGIPVFDLNTVSEVSLYIDGADEIDENLRLIKGGGGALTREKILATASKKFICIADMTKQVKILAKKFPLPIEVIPMARSLVARGLVKLGGSPVYRENYKTDNTNIILDVYDLDILEPIKWENILNNMVGIVEHGLFASRSADIVLVCDASGQLRCVERP
jgi:ribose 5-phosphate isomerase A